MNIEQIKFSLSRSLSDVGNKDMNAFIHYVGSFLPSHFNFSKENVDKGLTSRKLLFFPEISLSATVYIYNESKFGEDAYYREVTFEECSTPPGQSHVVFVPGKNNSRVQIKDFDIKDGKLILSRYYNTFTILDDYTVTRDKVELSDTLFVSFDVANRKIESSEVFGGNLLAATSYEFSGGVSGHFYHKEWDEKLSKAVASCSKFAEFSGFLKLDSLSLTNIGDTLLLAYVYITNDSLSRVLESEWWRGQFLNFVHYPPNFTKSSADCYENYILKNIHDGSDLWSIFGFKDEFKSFCEEHLFSCSLSQIIETKFSIDELSKVFQIETSDDLRKVVNLIPGLFKDKGRSYIERDASLGELLYLGSKGYTLDELETFMKKADQKEAITPYTFLPKFYEMFYYRDILKGKNHKFFPSYLSVTSAVILRDFKSEKGNNDGLLKKSVYNYTVETRFNSKLFESARNRRKELVDDHKDYEIILVSKDELTPEIYGFMLEKDDVLHFRKKRGKLYISIRIHGNMIISISERLPEAHQNNLRAWAKRNGLVFEPRRTGII